MFTRPDELPDSSILGAVRAGWGFDAVAVDYLAAGFGSHHWVAVDSHRERRFLTVDDLASKEFLGSGPAAAFDGLRAAFAAARGLHDRGLDWVIAPLTGPDGQVLRWLDARHSIAVFPFVEGTTEQSYASPDERVEVAALLAELHKSWVHPRARTETFRLPNRADLEAALERLGEPWSAGPYAEPARVLLRQRAGDVRRCLAGYDQLATQAGMDKSSWTVTHGEPHSSNVLRTSAGLRLIDWDTALLGPVERDLWMLVEPGGNDPVGQWYTEATGRTIRRELLSLYALWWDLCEIGIYVSLFRSKHEDTDDSRVSWQGLQESIQSIQTRTP